MSNDWQDRKVGALWQNKGKKGTFFSGTLDLEDGNLKVIVFKNNFKKDNPNAPDWVIYKSENGEDKPTPKKTYKNRSNKDYNKPVKENREVDQDPDVEFD
ncbi:MAG: hypothetical protein AABY22_16230 [Nanoarchaeota archaeon]